MFPYSIIQLTETIKMHLFKNPIPKFPLLTKRTNIFGTSLQTEAGDCNRPLGLRHGRLMMMKLEKS
jgi:hypothetical protein